MNDLEKLRPYNKIAMAGILSNPPLSKTSHNAGWTLVYKNYLEFHLKKEIKVITEKDDWSQFDCILLNHGVNYRPGVYNLFGGVSDSLITRINELKKVYNQNHIGLYSLDYQFNLEELSDKRNLGKTQISGFDVITPLTEPQEWMIIGDSHSISVYEPGWGLRRYDGKTLHGILKESLPYVVPHQVERLKLYFGNIDIRHHLCRQDDPIKATKDLIFQYYLDIRDLIQAPTRNIKDIQIILPLPLEDESRKVPGTGLYKGTPFYGSLSARNEVRHIFIHEIKKRMVEFERVVSLRSWDAYKDEDGKLPFDKMEARQSVHLRPECYPYYKQIIN